MKKIVNITLNVVLAYIALSILCSTLITLGVAHDYLLTHRNGLTIVELQWWSVDDGWDITSLVYNPLTNYEDDVVMQDWWEV